MHINPSLKAREIAGETIIVLPGKSKTEPTRILSLNPTSKFLWENLQGKEFTPEDAVRLLLDQYEVSEQQASEDVDKWIDQLKGCDVIVE